MTPSVVYDCDAKTAHALLQPSSPAGCRCRSGSILTATQCGASQTKEKNRTITSPAGAHLAPLPAHRPMQCLSGPHLRLCSMSVHRQSSRPGWGLTGRQPGPQHLQCQWARWPGLLGPTDRGAGGGGREGRGSKKWQGRVEERR